MPPQIADPGAGPSALEGAQNGTGNADDGRAQVMGAIRDLGSQIDALSKQLPAAQGELQQMRSLIRKIILKAGAGAPNQNDSATKLPMGG